MKARKPLTRKYFSALKGLYGNTPYEVKVKIKKASLKKDDEESELRQQIKLSVWLTKQNILHFAIPNGGSRHMLEAINLKRSGVMPGVPDMCIPVPHAGFNGLYIELKKSNGKLSDTQQEWLDKLAKNGYCAKVAYGYDEAVNIVQQYFERDI
jgi:hypothetical protein